MKIKNLLVLTAIAFTFTLFACSDDSDPTSTVDPKTWNYDAHMDSVYYPGDNFYMYCIGTWYDNYDLGELDYWGLMGNESQLYIDEYAKKMNSPITAKFYADAANVDNTTQAATEALINALSIAEDIETQEDAWAAIAKAMKMGYTPFFKLHLTPKNRIWKALLQVGDIYRAEEESENEEEKARIISKNLQELGYSSDEISRTIAESNQVKKILKENDPGIDLSFEYMNTHPERQEQIVPLKDAKTRIAEEDMFEIILGELGIDEEDVYLDEDLISYYETVANLSPSQIQSFIRTCIQDDYVFVSHEAFEEVFPPEEGLWDYFIENFVQTYMTYIQSYDYVTNVFTNTQKEEVISKCKELIEVYKKRINNLDWMSSVTKEKAILKLDNMILNVGYPDKWIQEGLPELTGTSLVEDVIQIKGSVFNATKACVGKTAEEASFNAIILINNSSLMVDNAYYYSGLNSLIILPIYITKPYYSQDYSDAFNYSTLASTMGHEITHALDINGSKFDEYGNYKNWWTVADKMAFEERQQKLVDCISHLEIMPEEMPNVFADGEQTIGENTADLGGVELAHQAYMEKLSEEGYCGEELIKQEKRFFQAYAEQWRAKYSADYAIWALGADVHSLPKERINGIVMNIDRWYELFDVNWGDNLYLYPEKRAHIW